MREKIEGEREWGMEEGREARIVREEGGTWIVIEGESSG